MLSLDRLFQSDFEDGSLDVIALSPLPLELVALAKTLAHWLSTGLLLVVLSPLLGLLMQLDGMAYLTLIAAMALGTPTLSLFGSIGAALTVGVKRGGVLLSLLVIPLYIPVLIFGALVVDGALARLKDEATTLDEAIQGAVENRVRPILMTTATSLAGLAPMVLFPGSGSELYRGVGSVVLGGLTLATALTLFVVPSLFALIWRLRLPAERR